VGTEYDLTTQKSGLLLTTESPLVPDLIRRAGPPTEKRFCRWIGLSPKPPTFTGKDFRRVLYRSDRLRRIHSSPNAPPRRGWLPLPSDSTLRRTPLRFGQPSCHQGLDWAFHSSNHFPARFPSPVSQGPADTR